jgi:hypothetical protein
MSRDRLRTETVWRRGSIALSAAALAVAGLGAGSAQGATGQRGVQAHQVNRSGTYNGQINQLLPKPYTGHIHFVVRQGKITGLRFTAGTMCGAMWAIDKDHALPTFPVVVKSSGAFSYTGTVAGRLIRLHGRITGHRAHGTFFQAFSTSGLTCSMGQAAVFTATR